MSETTEILNSDQVLDCTIFVRSNGFCDLVVEGFDAASETIIPITRDTYRTLDKAKQAASRYSTDEPAIIDKRQNGNAKKTCSCCGGDPSKQGG